MATSSNKPLHLMSPEELSEHFAAYDRQQQQGVNQVVEALEVSDSKKTGEALKNPDSLELMIQHAQDHGIRGQSITDHYKETMVGRGDSRQSTGDMVKDSIANKEASGGRGEFLNSGRQRAEEFSKAAMEESHQGPNPPSSQIQRLEKDLYQYRQQQAEYKANGGQKPELSDEWKQLVSQSLAKTMQKDEAQQTKTEKDMQAQLSGTGQMDKALKGINAFNTARSNSLEDKNTLNQYHAQNQAISQPTQQQTQQQSVQKNTAEIALDHSPSPSNAVHTQPNNKTPDEQKTQDDRKNQLKSKFASLQQDAQKEQGSSVINIDKAIDAQLRKEPGAELYARAQDEQRGVRMQFMQRPEAERNKETSKVQDAAQRWLEKSGHGKGKERSQELSQEQDLAKKKDPFELGR